MCLLGIGLNGPIRSDDVQKPTDSNKQWYASKESIESAKQMGITAQGYIDSMEATQKALSNCVIELFNMTRPPEVELGKIQGLVKTMGLDKLLDKAESK